MYLTSILPSALRKSINIFREFNYLRQLTQSRWRIYLLILEIWIYGFYAVLRTIPNNIIKEQIPSSRRIGVLVNWNLYSKGRIFYPKPMSVHEGVLVYLHSKRYTILFLTRQVLTQVLRVLSIRNTNPEGEHFHTKSCLITRECYDIYSISSYC